MRHGLAPLEIMTRSDPRREVLERWIAALLPGRVRAVEIASADASFRRYFRVRLAERDPLGESLVVMDAPPEREDIRPYLHVARLLERTGVHVPHVHEVDLEQGLVLLEDLGTRPFLGELRAPGAADRLYGDALAALVRIAVAGRELAAELPPYDAPVLRREMNLLTEWFTSRHLGLELDAEDQAVLRCTFDFLIAECAAQPVTFVHRDFHSRNLMVVPGRGPGIIDFQDALRGPLAYDLVSLLKDCYIEWPRERVEGWLRVQHDALRRAGFADLPSPTELLRQFDLVGLQRHIKVLGIFARLWYRDGKPGYLADLPLTLRYAQDAAARFGELQPFARWLERRVAPRLATAQPRALAPPVVAMGCPA
jgi:hypothetical protein